MCSCGPTNPLDSSVLTGEDFLLVTGIADTHHLVTHLKKKYKTFDHIKFKDHHHYSLADAQMINDRAEKTNSNDGKGFRQTRKNHE